MRGTYQPNRRAIVKRVHYAVNNLYWLVSNTGSLTKCPDLGKGHEEVVVSRHVINVLTMEPKHYVLYLSIMYNLNEEEEHLVNFEVNIPETDITDLHLVINQLIIGILNSDTLVSECGVKLNRDNFIKYAGLVGYTDQYEPDSVESSLYEMMISDTSIPPTRYEGIRLLELSDFLGEFIQKSTGDKVIHKNIKPYITDVKLSHQN